MTIAKKILLLFAISFLTYLPSFWNQFVWDDEQFIYKNQYVINFDVTKIFSENTTAGSGQQSDYYRPLTTLSFAIDHAIWGLRPFGFHLTNTLLHILAGIFIYLLLKELWLNKAKNLWQDTPFWITLLFLIHPIQTEAVVYMNSRGDSLFAFLGMLSLYLFSLIFRKEKISIYTLTFNKIEILISSLVLYFLTILAKEIGIMLTGLFWLILLVQLIKSVNKPFIDQIFVAIKKHLIHIIGAISSTVLGVFYMILRSTIWNFGNTYNLYHGQNEYTSSLLIRILTFTKINFIYFKLLLFPYPLHMERSTQLITKITTFWPWILLIILISIIAIGLVELKKAKTTWIWFGLIWFYIGLVPVSGIIPINGLLYEHWLYLPMIGFFICITQMLKLLFSTIKLQMPLQLIKLVIFSIFAILIILTIRQNWIWRNPISFYTYQLQYSVSARMLNNLAMAYSEAKNHNLAIEYYQKAINFADQYPQTHYNLANTYLETNQLDLAIGHFNKAIQMNQNFDLAYGPLINIYLQKENYQQALPLLDHLIEQYPTDAQTQLIKVNVLLKLNKTKQAQELSQEILTKSNFHPQAKSLIDQIFTDNQATPSAPIY